MTRLARWWRRRQHRRAVERSGLLGLSTRLEALAHEFRAHRMATDLRLELHDVLMHKSLADLNLTLGQLAASQRELVTALKDRLGATATNPYEEEVA